jgi:hypothetical protein
MEGFMIVYIMIFYFCIVMLVLAVMIGLVIFFEKTLSDSSIFRKPLAFIAGTGADLVGLLVVFMVGGYVIVNNSSLLRYNSMTDEMVQRRFDEMEFNIYVTYVLMFLSGILVSILAGYIAGKIARRDEVKYGLATSVVISLMVIARVGIPLYLQSRQDYLYLIGQNYALQLIVGTIVIIAAVGSATLGGYFALIQRRKKSGENTAAQIVAPN